MTSEGLGLDAENREFKRLQEQAQQALAKVRQVRELLQKAIQQRQGKDHQAVLRTMEELLVVDPQHVEALEMHRQAAEAVERQGKVEELLAAARAHGRAQEHEACVEVTSEGLILDPGSREFKRLQEQAQEILAKRRKVQELVERARQQWGREEYTHVLQTVEELLRVEPGYGEALKLKRQAREALAKRQRVEELVERARQQGQRQDHEGVLGTVEELLTLEPGHGEALALKRQAGAALGREQKMKELLAAARTHAQAQEYEACLTVTSEGLKLDPGNVELGKLQASAQQVLEERRLQEERRALLDRLWTSARADVQKHRFKLAYRTLGQLLELEPGHREALALRQHAEVALAVQRQKIRRVLPIAAGLLLAVALGTGGLLKLRNRKGAGFSSPSAEGNPEAPVSPGGVRPAPVAIPSTQDPKISQALEKASSSFETKKYSEAAREAKEVLELSPGDTAAENLLKQAQESLDKIAAGNRQAKSLKEAGKFEEAIASLGAVLRLAPSDPEARKLLKELDQYARKGADEAMTQSKQARSASEAARAPGLVRNLFDAAQGTESEAMALYRAKQYTLATAKFSESREAYQRAAIEARSRTETEEQRQETARQENQLLARQQASQREAVQTAREAYDHARDKASQAGAETRALERFQQATGLASQAQAKRDRGDLQGARQDFEMAASAMELAATTAETLARQSQIEPAGRVKDTAQKETDRQGVEQILKSYKAAWESKDLDRLKTLWPGLGGGKEKKIKQTFEFSRSIKIDLQPTNIHIAGNAATVTCQRQDQTVTVKGDKFSSKPFNTTLTLRRAGGTWVIDDVRLADE
ncbi:MAG: hypothetical protein DMG06_16260 [Acidobacteria bacterium]|nr:MAG: hypothetical protein DMG06_16260 [Acidobacteriota bacterium]